MKDKKLNLNKTTISTLSSLFTAQIRGGGRDIGGSVQPICEPRPSEDGAGACPSIAAPCPA